MFVCKSKFNFLDKTIGVTKDGEKYVAINVIPAESTQKLNFISKDEEVIKIFSNVNLSRFAEITLKIGFEREYNSEKRISYWVCKLLGAE